MATPYSQTPGTGAPPELDVISSEKVMLNVNLFVFGTIGVLVLFRLPHLIGLFRTTSEWCKGYFLHYSKPEDWRTSVTKTQTTQHNVTLPAMDRTTDAHFNRHRLTKSVVTVGCNDSTRKTADNQLDYHRFSEKQGVQSQSLDTKYPPHYAVVPWFLRPILVLSRVRVFDGYTVGQLVLLAGYLYGYLYGMFSMSNPFSDSSRSAWVAVSQMPLVFALAQKNNIIGSLLGYGYEKVSLAPLISITSY